ncbi:MAG: DUF4202 domain-containing protein [Verrucomicrobiota bacterium]
MNSPLSLAKAALNAAHSADPKLENGVPAELLYADRLELWLNRLVPTPSLALSIAGRAQHLERWVIPRSDFPMDRPGYHNWRTTVHRRQGQRAEELLLAAGIDATVAARVNTLVAKLSKDEEGQALEDAACLVFLEHELPGFAASHPDYTREKFITIIRRTWKKMSASGHALAATVPLSPELAALVQEALAP